MNNANPLRTNAVKIPAEYRYIIFSITFYEMQQQIQLILFANVCRKFLHASVWSQEDKQLGSLGHLPFLLRLEICYPIPQKFVRHLV